MSTLKLEHIAHIDNAGPDISIDTNGNVGIGTTSPDRSLHVTRADGTGTVIKVGNTGTSSATIEFSDTSTTDTVSIGSVGNDLTLKSDDGDISFNTTSDPATASMYIERGGNVGIGVTDPDSALEVQSASSGNNSLHIANTSSTGYGAKFLGGGNTATRYIADFRNYSGVSKVKIDGDGNVGIGTTSPSAPLTIGSGATSRGSYSDLLIAPGGDNAQIEMWGANTSFAISHFDNDRLGIYSNVSSSWSESRGINIKADGNVGIGTTSPQRMLHIHDGSQTGLHITNTQSGAGANDGFSQYIRDDNQATELMVRENSYLGFGTNNQLKVKITNSGILEGLSDAEIKTSPIRKHSNTISTNTTIDSSENAIASGPISVATGVTLTINGNMTVV